MGRYETLNPASKDVINCLLPGIAANFGVTNPLDIIPEDIRPRAWHVDRKEHIVHKSEDDPRNWGLQFLKDMISISRLKQGKLEEFQEDLRKKVETHTPEHPWAQLKDIKEIKEHYEKPEIPLIPVEQFGDSQPSSSESSYYEELVEPEPDGPRRRGRRRSDQPVVAMKMKEVRPRKNKRLRSSSTGGWERPDKAKRQARTPSIPIEISEEPDDEDLEGMTVDELEAHLRVSQAELKTARLNLKVIEARRKAGNGRKAAIQNEAKTSATRKPATYDLDTSSPDVPKTRVTRKPAYERMTPAQEESQFLATHKPVIREAPVMMKVTPKPGRDRKSNQLPKPPQNDTPSYAREPEYDMEIPDESETERTHKPKTGNEWNAVNSRQQSYDRKSDYSQASYEYEGYARNRHFEREDSYERNAGGRGYERQKSGSHVAETAPMDDPDDEYQDDEGDSADGSDSGGESPLFCDS